MESMLGFKENEANDVVESKSHSKLVPWMSWDEWKFVSASLFSSSLDSVTFALQRISTWRSRGCIPVAVDVTASIVEIQQKDPSFRNELDEAASQSEEMLVMLYCMAIVRLVNGVVEKTREKNMISIGEAADAIGIPRMLIDIRHEGSHRDLPSLQLVRLASTKALDWLKSYYWEPQEKVIPVQNNKTADLRKEIKRSLRDVSLCLKAKQTAKLSSDVKGKRVKQTELVHGRSKFILLAAGKSSQSNSTGSKKLLKKALKNTLRLFSSFSTEVVYLLLEYLLNALEASSSSEHHFVDSTQNNNTAFDDWKSVVLKLSRKEPELLLILTQAVLEKMEMDETMNCKTGDHPSPVDSAKARRFELLSYLFEWLIGNLKTLNPAGSMESAETKGSKMEKHLTRATVLALLRRCLLASLPGNKQLVASAVALAQLTGEKSIVQKLRKLALLEQPSLLEANSTGPNDETLSQQEYSIRQAKEKLELMKRQRMVQNKHDKPSLGEVGSNRKWSVAKSWTPCPIGMLPHTIGFSGRLPTLDCVDSCRDAIIISCTREDGSKESNGKREAEISTEKMDGTAVKRVGIEADFRRPNESNSNAEGMMKGYLMMEGLWKKVEEREIFRIASAVKIMI